MPTPEQVIEKVCKDKRELLKLSLNDSLERGIDIKTEEQYTSLVKLLKENEIIDLANTTFSDISKNGRSFAIKRVTPEDTFVTIFRGAPFSRFNIKGSYFTGGIIQNGGKFEINTIRDMNMSVLQISGDTILKEAEACQVTEKKETSHPPVVYSNEIPKGKKTIKKQPPQTKESLLPTLDTIYTVKKGDSLWKIVQDYYGITNNRELANFINKLAKYNSVQAKLNILDNVPRGGDGISGDRIIIGKTIYLPKDLKFKDTIKSRIK